MSTPTNSNSGPRPFMASSGLGHRFDPVVRRPVDLGPLDGFVHAAGPTRPADFDPVDLASIPKPELKDVRGLGEIAASTVHLSHHHVLSRVDIDQGANRVAIAPGGTRSALGAVQAKADVVLAREPV